MSAIIQRQELHILGRSDLSCSVHPLHHASHEQKRLLLVSVSAGNGHVRAAQAIAAHAWRDFPQLRLQHIDMMQIVPTLFRKLYSDLYIKLASGLPEAWGWLYRKTDCEPGHSLSGRLRRGVQRLCSQGLFREIDRFKPDVIICTHFLPAEILAAAVTEKRLNAQVWVQVTDFDLHQMWLHPGVHGYFVANEELAFRLQSQGIPRASIVVTGIPVMPAFDTRPDKFTAAARLGLNPDCFTVLLMGGGAGIGMDPVWIAELIKTQPQLQVIVMTGKNVALHEALAHLRDTHANRLRIVGFTEDVAALMMAADLAITKPGGLSSSECLVCGLPMLLVNPIPGQEERNAAFLMQEGVAQRADDPLTLQFRLQKLLADPERLTSMRARAIALGRPHAALQVLERVA